jgi:hypothetical protein
MTGNEELLKDIFGVEDGDADKDFSVGGMLLEDKPKPENKPIVKEPEPQPQKQVPGIDPTKFEKMEQYTQKLEEKVGTLESRELDRDIRTVDQQLNEIMAAYKEAVVADDDEDGKQIKLQEQIYNLRRKKEELSAKKPQEKEVVIDPSAKPLSELLTPKERNFLVTMELQHGDFIFLPNGEVNTATSPLIKKLATIHHSLYSHMPNEDDRIRYMGEQWNLVVQKNLQSATSFPTKEDLSPAITAVGRGSKVSAKASSLTNIPVETIKFGRVMWLTDDEIVENYNAEQSVFDR